MSKVTRKTKEMTPTKRTTKEMTPMKATTLTKNRFHINFFQLVSFQRMDQMQSIHQMSLSMLLHID